VNFRHAVGAITLLLVVAFYAPIAEGADSITIALQSVGIESDPQDETDLNLHIFAPLVARLPDGTIVPSVAQSWDVSDDGRTWTFHLAKGLKFHGGDPITSEDVKFSLERAAATPGEEVRTSLQGASVETVDDFTVKLTTDNLHMYSDVANLPIISHKAAGLSGLEAKQQAFTSGPYVPVNLVPNQGATLKKNTQYSLASTAWEEVTLREVSDPTARVALLLSGDVDVIDGVPPNEIEGLSGKVQIAGAASDYVEVLQFGPANSPISNSSLREAIDLGLDRRRLAQVESKRANAAVQPALDLVAGYSSGVVRGYDLKKAQDLVQSAAPGQPITIFHAQGSERGAQAADEIKDMINNIGLKGDVAAIDVKDAFGGKLPKDMPWTFVYATALAPSASEIAELVGPAGKDNLGGWSEPAISQALKKSGDFKDLMSAVDKTRLLLPLFRWENVWAARPGIGMTPSRDGLLLVQYLQTVQAACSDCKSGYRYCLSKSQCLKADEQCDNWCK